MILELMTKFAEINLINPAMAIKRCQPVWHSFFLILIFEMLATLAMHAVSPSRLYFDHYNDRNGLTSNSVNYIMQDCQGFIWVATKDGLNRFDGFNFRHIDTGERESCSWVLTILRIRMG